jgi:hypothetical protein
MSVKGFFIALLCLGAGIAGLDFSFYNIISANRFGGWIILLIASFIAVFFGMGVLAGKIKI